MSNTDNFTQPELEFDEISIEEQLEDVEDQIIEVKKNIRVSDALTRLQESEDYKIVIEEAYFTEEVNRVVEALTNPTYMKRDQLQNLTGFLDNIRGLKTFFETIKINNTFSKEKLEELENMKVELKRVDNE